MADMQRKPKSFRKILATLAGLLLVLMIALAAVFYFQIHRTNGEIVSSGQKRTYLLYVPAQYRPDRPSPLVISIHGFAEWPAHQMEITRWNQAAEENNFIVVYPSGSGFPLRWRAGATDDHALDVQFIADLIDRLAQEYNIDPTRIYANGLSNGGGMSFMVACELSGRIAAFGSVSGAYLLPWDQCRPERPVPAVIFHGTDDLIVPFGGGRSASFDIPFPVVTDWVAALAARNGCAQEPVEQPAQGEVSAKRYSGCDQNADVVYYVVDSGGHAWPGGGPMPAAIVGHITQDIDATRVMWEFFEQHPMGK